VGTCAYVQWAHADHTAPAGALTPSPAAEPAAVRRVRPRRVPPRVSPPPTPGPRATATGAVPGGGRRHQPHRRSSNGCATGSADRPVGPRAVPAEHHVTR